jgi:hypothetical protein
MALERVTSSANSISPPIGSPYAILVIFTPSGFNSCVKYCAVVSPLVLGFVAIMTSEVPPAFTLLTNF